MSNITPPSSRGSSPSFGKLLLSAKVFFALLPTALFSRCFFASFAAAVMGNGTWSTVFVSGLISAPMVAVCWAIIDSRRKALRSENG